MLINGLDLGIFGVKLFDRVIKSNTVETYEDWIDGDIQPTFTRQQDRFKNIKLTFLVLGPTEEEAFFKISKLTQALRNAEIKFDDMDLTFKVKMTGEANPTRLKNGNFTVEYNFTSDYAFGESVVYTTNANLTNAFKLNVLYYKNSTILLATDSITVRAAAFKDDGTDTFASIGIEVDKYKPEYFNPGIATNFQNLELSYDNLLSVGTLIVNYEPTAYNLTLNYFIDNGTGVYGDLVEQTITFTQPQLQNIQTIGQLIDVKTYKPNGYSSTIAFTGNLTVEDLLIASPISIFYKPIQNERTKNVVINYYEENDNSNYDFITSTTINVVESDFDDGFQLKNLINTDAYRPNVLYYNEGIVEDHALNEFLTYDTCETIYNVKYTRTTNTLFVEYYIGTYPGWYRLTTIPTTTKYLTSFDTNFELDDLNIDVNKYHTSEYQEGIIYNNDSLTSYEEVLNIGVIQVYYTPLNYNIAVRYYQENDLIKEETITINALQFLNEPVLADIIAIAENKPEGYQFDTERSYSGEVSLNQLTLAAPINIYYEEVEAARTKNIVIKYKQELSSAYSTLNTSLITVSEADCVGGVRIKDIINLNAYKPDYYESGAIDGYSSTALTSFDDLQSNYDVLYLAASYSLPIRYYVNTTEETNWIGSNAINYRIIDFTVDTTLYDLGLNLNAFKPSYCGDGELQYNGPVNFTALYNLSSINILYIAQEEPDDPSGIDYPHRFLFLEHNALGEYESTHPNWTMNHAYINTGITADDMSKLTVIMECARVDQNVPLADVNAGYGYLFGSSSPSGQFYMRFHNQTSYTGSPQENNTYEAKAGLYTNELVLTESSAIGFSSTSGIYASAQAGYSRATFTYTNSLQSESAQMSYPLYLFANNNAGTSQGWLAGIGIYGCRIYYNNVLVRDMIPVQFYDKIGDKVAPSNCLYDKITQTFFEDATGQNSFNIIDDDRYTDTNLEHKIGVCYVNYIKGNTTFKTSAIYFRGNDFENVYNPYTKFAVDENQPAYTQPGIIQNYNTYTWDFDSMNHSIYNVVYEEIETQITVNYYKDDGVNEPELLQTETIPLVEADFYQSPTFGDIVRLNKYKPEGYETNFVYPGAKVSLNRVVSNSPYNIVYTPVEGTMEEYTTTIRYIKKVYGVRTYTTIDEIVLTLDQTDFRDGEYIDFYIDMNAFKPENYYLDGETYQWYPMDERITTPENLKQVYVIAYMPEVQYIEVNYYDDIHDEEHLIASTTWGVSVDTFDPEYPFYVVDNLPNNAINKYRPAGCDSGILQNSSTSYTFETLMELDEIAIIYPRREEHHDPAAAIYVPKVLYWGTHSNNILWDLNRDFKNAKGMFRGGCIPYIDLGYRPKEIGRLRVEMTCYAQPLGFKSATTQYLPQNDVFLSFFGYQSSAVQGTLTKDGEVLSHGSKGFFEIQPKLANVGGYVYTAEGPQEIDGQTFFTGSAATGVITNPNPTMKTYGMSASYRKGLATDTDVDYNEFEVFHKYGVSDSYQIESEGIPRETDGYMQIRTEPGITQALANPYTVIMDAYNGYFSISTYANSNTPYTRIIEDIDVDIFEDREQPRGSLSVFRTTNPSTGKINIMPFNISTFASMTGGIGSMELSGTAVGNPFESGWHSSVTQTVEVITGYAQDGSPIIEKKSQSKNINYASFQVPVYPQIAGLFIWGIKIYDRDRLVRNLIPVAEGDQVYDYVMPANGLFDLESEIFFGNSNTGGTYTYTGLTKGNDGQAGASATQTITIGPEDVEPFYVVEDLLTYGQITTNYYDYDNEYLGNQAVLVPTWFCGTNDTIEDILHYNDLKPDDFHLDGWLDIDEDLSFEDYSLAELYEMGLANVYYRLRTFTKTVVYYRDNVRVGSRDVFYSLDDIKNAQTLADLNIDLDLYYTDQFKHGRVVFNEADIANDDIAAFIDAPSPIVVYDKLTQQEAPNLLYIEYYRGGAYDDTLITLDNQNPNYLNCNLTGRVINPYGAVKYYNHYHAALYEDEVFDYFMPYQVRVVNHYTGIHNGPGRKYNTLAMIVDRDTYTIIQERNGWGRLREYPNGWILLNATEPITGPGQNPDYSPVDSSVATIGFGETITITKLTIDRLWCYSPELDSWIKAEDISYDQAGKLYNGMKIEVIDLNEIDFTSVSRLSDMGIYPQAYRLRFHEPSNYTYSGPYTYEAFSNLHSIEIVYDETIYNYTCIYYKDSLDEINELGRSAFSCSLSDWNPDWDTFIETSWQVDENEDPINPTLYRDTAITLYWDYFGFDNNKFRPAGSPEGIYIWNPRDWDVNNPAFTFEELIKTGSQKVLYPCVEPNIYKAFWKYGIIKTYNYLDSSNHTKTGYYRSVVPINFLTGKGPSYDITTKLGVISYDLVGADSRSSNSYRGIFDTLTSNSNIQDSCDYTRPYVMAPRQWRSSSSGGYTVGNVSGSKNWYEDGLSARSSIQSKFISTGNDLDYLIYNISRYRDYFNLVWAQGNSANEQPLEFYNSKNEKIEYTTNLSGETIDFDEQYDANPYGSSPRMTYYYPTRTDIESGAYKVGACIFYSLQSYYQFELKHWWIPIPKGTWYKFGGEDLRITENGFIDLITGDFIGDQDGSKEITIYQANKVISSENVYDYFNGWEFNKTERQTFIQVNAATTTYKAPDLYAIQGETIPEDTLVPTVAYTADAANKVIGEWYELPNGYWIPSSSGAIMSLSANYKSRFSNERNSFALVPEDPARTFYVYTWPEDSDVDPYDSSNTSYGTETQVIQSYYTYSRTVASTGNQVIYYFDGKAWIPREYTSNYITESNRTYAITRDCNYYQYPVLDDSYKVSKYLYGDRITVLYTATNNPDWGYTGEGWIQLAGNTSEVL